MLCASEKGRLCYGVKSIGCINDIREDLDYLYVVV